MTKVIYNGERNIDINFNNELGEIQDYIIKKLNIWLHDISYLLLKYKNSDKKIIGSDELPFNSKIDNDDIVEYIEILPKNSDDSYIEKFNQYIQIKQDEYFAMQLQNESFLENMINDENVYDDDEPPELEETENENQNENENENQNEGQGANNPFRYYFFRFDINESVGSINLLNMINSIVPPDSDISQFIQQIITGNNQFQDVKVVNSEEDLSKLKTIKFEDLNDKKNTQCHFCLEEYKNDDILLILPCNHYEHESCIKEWLINQSNKCPVCKESVFDGHAV